MKNISTGLFRYRYTFLFLSGFLFLNLFLADIGVAKDVTSEGTGISGMEMIDDAAKKLTDKFKSKNKDRKKKTLIDPSRAKSSIENAGINTGIEVGENVPRCPPYGVGDLWTIRRTNILANGMASEAEFTITITENDGKTVEIESVEPQVTTIKSEMLLKKGVLYPVKDTMKDAMGVIEIDYISETSLCPPPKVGESIVARGQMNGMPVGERSTTVTAINPNYIEVSVPAGTFRTLKIDSLVKESGPQTNPPHTITHYYADGVGSVKEVFRFADGSIQVHELLGYKY